MKPASYGKLVSSLPEPVRELYMAIEKTVKTREEALSMSLQLRTISAALEIKAKELPVQPPPKPTKVTTVGDFLREIGKDEQP